MPQTVVERVQAPEAEVFVSQASLWEMAIKVSIGRLQVDLQALERHRWQREVTAEALGIHRKTLFTKMKKYALI